MAMRFFVVSLLVPFALVAQTITCTMSTTPLPVRAESLGDLVGDVEIQCMQTRPGADPRQYLVGDVTLYLNANVTNYPSPIYGGALTDAVLVINDNNAAPTAASTLGGPQGNVPVPQYGEVPTQGGRSVANALIWRGVRVPVPGASTGTGSRFPDPTRIRLSNVRSNGNQLGISSTLVPSVIYVYSVTIADAKELSGSKGTAGVGEIYFALSSFVRRGTINSIPACEGQSFPGTDPTFSVRVTEGFNSAFLPLGTPATTMDQRTGEAGYATPGIGANGGGATQGTRVRIVINNTSFGVRLAVPKTVTSGTLRLQLVNTDPIGAGAYAPVSGEGLQELSVSGGAAVAVYEVVGADSKAVESIDVPFYLGAQAGSGLGSTAVNAMLAPTSTFSRANASSPLPRFADVSSARNAFSVVPCTAGTPLITGLSPSSASLSGPGFSLTITGIGFQQGATVQWQGRSLPATFVNSRTLTASVTQAELQAATSSGTADIYVVNPSGVRSAMATFAVNTSQNAPRINSGGVVDAAAGRARLAPGGIGSIYGANLAAGEQAAATLPLPRELQGARVLVNGVQAPLFYVSPGQINFQAPYEMTTSSAAAVAVARDGGASLSASVAAALSAPQVFRSGAGVPIVVHSDGALVTSARPASASEVLVVYATGVGALSNRPASGEAAPAAPLAYVSDPVTVTVGGARAEVVFSGLTPGLAGLVQFNIQLPAALPGGSSLPLVVTVGGADSDPVDLPVR